MIEILEEIKRMLRHLHSDVENIKRKEEILEYRITNLAFLIRCVGKEDITEKELDEAVNLDPDLYSDLDNIYSPIDEIDKKLWEEHLKKERESKGI